jgi:PhnB protein
MTISQPEMWVDAPAEAVTFYEAAFGATAHRAGEGNDIVAQLDVDGAAFWVSTASSSLKRLRPRAIGGATSRTLLVVENPMSVIRQAVTAGATETAYVQGKHGWQLGRIIDPFGHEREIGRPLGRWPPA